MSREMHQHRTPNFDPQVNFDLSYHSRIPYAADSTTPIHRWYLINESQALTQIQDLFRELHVDTSDLVIDPFAGSGAVALQSLLTGIRFLGIEILATCVIATRAKLMAGHIDPQEFEEHCRSILNTIYFGHNKLDASDSADRGLDKIQQAVLNHHAIKPATWILLATLYSAASGLGDNAIEGLTARHLLTSFGRKLSEVVWDVRHFHQSRPPTADQKVLWASSTDLDWDFTVGSQTPKRIVLITSLPFPKTSQNCNPTAHVLELAARQALQQLGEIPPITANPATHPSPVVPYLDLVKTVLRQLRALGAEETVAVLECECLSMEDPESMLDWKVCEAAAELGFEPGIIRVTHFVSEAGTACDTPTDTRGSLVYLRALA